MNVSFQMDDTVAIDDRVKKVKPLIEAAIPYTFQDFSRWKPSIQYMISKVIFATLINQMPCNCWLTKCLLCFVDAYRS